MRKTLLQTLLAAFCAILCALSGMGGGGVNRRRILAAMAPEVYEVAWIGNDEALANGEMPYVETGIIGTENLGWEFTFDFYPTPGGSRNMTLGARSAYQYRQYFVNFGNNGGIGWGNKNSLTVTKSLTVASLNNHVKFDAVTGVASALGSTVNRPSAFTTPFSVNLFGDFSAENAGVRRCCHLVGHIIYTDRQGVVTHEFVPMVRGGEACYFETVGRRWYYPTGGVLTAGTRV